MNPRGAETGCKPVALRAMAGSTPSHAHGGCNDQDGRRHAKPGGGEPVRRRRFSVEELNLLLSAVATGDACPRCFVERLTSHGCTWFADCPRDQWGFDDPGRDGPEYVLDVLEEMGRA